MKAEIFKYAVTALFVFITFYLSYIGMKKTKDLKSFSIGNKDMNPFLIGITMAASISSTATFVINPGFVYTHGLSAYLHFGVAALLGIFAAFWLLTKSFRRQGERMGALTIPHWIRERFGSNALALFFALINLLSITFVVLILVGCSILMAKLFPISQHTGLSITLVFVFSYVLLGGTYAHAYTNTFQGIMMIGISLFLFFHGLKYFSGGPVNALQSISLSYAAVINPESSLYNDFFSVFGSSFIITFALMLQPHILTKILYIRRDEDIKKFLGTTIVIGTIFSLVLFIGFYARLAGLEVPRQDEVVGQYLVHEFGSGTFGPYLMTFVSITLLAAGMSTLDGILVSLSAMVVNDIYLPYSKSKHKEKNGLRLSRAVLIAIGLISYAIAYHPPRLVGLFAQKGVYGLAAAALCPILVGSLFSGKLNLKLMWTCSLVGLFGHLGLNLFGGILNPAVSASYSILFSLLIVGLYYLIPKMGLGFNRMKKA